MTLIAVFFAACRSFRWTGSFEPVQFWTKSRGFGLAMLATISVACAPIVPDGAGAPTTTTPQPEPPASVTSEPVVPDSTVNDETTPATTVPAVEPAAAVIVASNGVLGWWDGEWREADDLDSVPALEGVEYTLVGPTGPVGVVTGSAALPGCGIIEEHLAMDLDPDPYGDFDAFTAGPVAISASWDPAPHPVTELVADSEVYGTIVTEFLASRGFEEPDPVITQLYRTDLEGDGTDEVVVVADNHNGEFFKSGVYSVVLVRKVIEGEVQTAVLHESLFGDPERDEIPFSITAQVAAIADLNGDGTSEIVLDDAYYEGAGSQVFDYINDDLGFVSVLLTGCGA